MDALLLIPGTLVVIGAMAVARVLFVPGGVTMEDLLMRSDLAWPRGVQEEEPVQWQFDRLTPPGHRHAARLAARSVDQPGTPAALSSTLRIPGARRAHRGWNTPAGPVHTAA